MNRELVVILATSFLLATPAAFPQQVPNAAPGFRPEGVYDFATASRRRQQKEVPAEGGATLIGHIGHARSAVMKPSSMGA